MNNTKIRLFIAEDHTLLLQGYLKLLSNNDDIAVVATAVNYYDIIHKLKIHPCDIILLDLSMPMAFNSQQQRLSGLDILDFIKKEKLPIHALITSTHRDYEIIKKAISLNAKGYVFKNIDYHDLLEAIRTVGEGKEYFQKEIKDILSKKETDDNRLVADGIKISPREKQILKLLAEGMKAEEIAGALGLVKYTIEEYRSNLIKKFRAKNTTHLIKIACDYNFI